MKIKRIDFKKHHFFNNHSVIFEEGGSIPIISFLVGNNGSGKTKILDVIFAALTQQISDQSEFEIDFVLLLSDEEKNRFGLPVNEVVLTKKYEVGDVQRHMLKDVAGNDLDNRIIGSFKVVFSTIEINFEEAKIASVTTKNIDDEVNPRGVSRKLDTEIPQLLVDISNLDNGEKGKWYDSVKGQTIAGSVPGNIGMRLNRFTDAFHSIFEGSKIFSTIDNNGGAKRIVFKDSAGADIGLNDLSTGEKQIIYRIGYILKNIGNIKGAVILIDEPEISLHPTWQMKLKGFLHNIFDPYDVQFIIATHSPYIFKDLDETIESCIKVDRSVRESKKVSLVFPRVPLSPSVNLINYLAYGIPSELLHIELYTLLQIREHKSKIKNSPGNNDGIEDWLQLAAGGNMPIRQTFVKTGKVQPTNETIMTWIRNKLHHSDEAARPMYNQVDLRESIDHMIRLLKRP